MTRREDWPSRLAGFLAAAHGRPFRWGEFDCCLFACDGVMAMTGVDPAARLRGRYKTARGALSALKRFAAGGLAGAATRIAGDLNAREVDPAYARRGDVALVAAPLAQPGFDGALGLVTGAWIAVLTPAGLRRLPLATATRVWRV